MTQPPLFEPEPVAGDPYALILITRRDCDDYSGFGMELTKVEYIDGRWHFYCVTDRTREHSTALYEHEIAAIVRCKIGVPDAKAVEAAA